MKKYIVIGLGEFGRTLARRLQADGQEVLAVDRREEAVEQLRGEVSRAVTADLRDPDAVLALEPAAWDCAVVAVEETAESVIVTMNLREAGAGEIICRANDADHRRVLLRLGADRVVLPEQESAAQTAENLKGFSLAQAMHSCGDLAEIPAPAAWIGRSLGEMDVRATLGITVLAVYSGSQICLAPGADYVTKEDDILVVRGDCGSLSAVK